MNKIKRALSPDRIEKNLACLSPIYAEETNGIEVYLFTGNEFPELIKEVGRLREITFREKGAGSGKSHDLDRYDTEFPCYRQIIVYDRNQRKITGGCRCFCPIFVSQEYHHRPEVMSSSKVFLMSKEFIDNYLPYTLDVGRTIVIPEIQAQGSKVIKKNNRSPLEYIWKGFGYLLNHYNIRYFFGRVVIYEDLNSRVRNLLYFYLATHFAAFYLVHPKVPIRGTPISHPFSKKNDYIKDLKKLIFLAKDEGKSISPLIRAYVRLSPTIKFFGSALDADLNNVEEMAVMITVKDIFLHKFKRFSFKEKS